MSHQQIDARSAKNAKLTAAVAKIELELASGTPTATLRALWADLVSVLALEPLHVVRDCPTCGVVGMQAATRCGHCWAKLTPPAAASSDAAL